MSDSLFALIYGTVREVRNFADQCCQQIVSLDTENGIVNVIVSPDTYVVNETRLRPGMMVAAFYDVNVPVPLIYPPQYRAVAIGVRRAQENVILDYFDRSLTAVNYPLKLNIGRNTEITTPNGQRFTCSPAGRLLLVYYGPTTRSIPPQTTPSRIIVMCEEV